MSNSSSSHLSKELLELVKSIGESRSKQEEDKIITAEAQSLKTKFLERNLPEKKMKELLIRALYVEMLGHDASFSYIHAVNLA
jgi:AP-4 complex subunit epsilon-1